jgi:aryl-alcohol dehydrogenase-like predicted oxidoreductase
MSQRPGPYESLVDDRVFDGLDRLSAEAESRGVDMATLALAWLFAHPHVSGAVCGPNTAAQLDPVLAARQVELSQADFERIGRFFE